MEGFWDSFQVSHEVKFTNIIFYYEHNVYEHNFSFPEYVKQY